MIEKDRPNPDRLLAAIRSDPTLEHSRPVGKLKVFLGMSAGVGKTFAMLQNGHRLLQEGVDVLVGVVETHGRPKTVELLVGLPKLGLKSISYRSKTLHEFDLDKMLTRKPQVALIDELAHSNVQGSRNEKRHQDIDELLLAGIDVITTVNIQHIESRKSVVEEFSKVRVHETVPDSFFEKADEIILIEIDPEDLLKRLHEGDVYKGEKIAAAQENFFSRVNLTALREMALRFTAGRVERDLLDEKELLGSQQLFRSSQKFLVAIFASPYSESLLRWTKQMTESVHGSWIAAYIENGQPLTAEEQVYLDKNFALVDALGGKLLTSVDEDPVHGLIKVARENNVTQIVVGKSKRGWLGSLRQSGNFTSRLLRESGDIDVYVVSSSSSSRIGTKPVRRWTFSESLASYFPFDEWGWAFSAIFLLWFLGGLLEPRIGYQSVGLLFLLLVFLGALKFSRGVVFFLAVVSSLIWDFFFIPPKLTLQVSEAEDAILLLLFFVTSLVMGYITNKNRTSNKRIQERENSTQNLYRATRDLSLVSSLDGLEEVITNTLNEAFGFPCAVLLRDGESLHFLSARRATFPLDEKEKAVANWVLNTGESAGRGTETLSIASAFYVPMLSEGKTMGVIALELPPVKIVPRNVKTLCFAVAQQAATVIQRENYRMRGLKVDLLQHTQRLYDALFDSVSHELKTPLTGIQGAASALLDPKTTENLESVRELSKVILESSERLTRTVDLMLDMSRLESGMLQPKLDNYSLDDSVEMVVSELQVEYPFRVVETHFPTDLPWVRADLGFFHTALKNVLRNALKFSPSQSKLTVSALARGSEVDLVVRDYGAGLPQGDPLVWFEKFTRGEPEKTGGLGLGLAIAKGFMEAQGGGISARNALDGGAEFTLTLPKGYT